MAKSRLLQIGHAVDPNFDALRKIASSDNDGDDTKATHVKIVYKVNDKGGRVTKTVNITGVTPGGRIEVETMGGASIGTISREKPGRLRREQLYLNH